MSAALVVIAAAVALFLWVRWLEPRMLYYPDRVLAGTPARLGWRFEDVRLVAEDGARLHGWFVPAEPAPARSPRLTVLFLHGNAGNISHRLDKLAILRSLGADVLIVDYRGYGASEGRPGEEGLHRDARAAWRDLTETRGVDPATIVIHGESLGAAVAARLAAETNAGGVVLETAFTSVADAAPFPYRLLPLRWMVRNRHDALASMPRIAVPVLIVHARGDEFFPRRHAERLAAASRSVTLVTLEGGHNDAFLVSAAAYRDAVAAFFALVAGAATTR